ncbi:MAG: hypothetical protein M1561_08020 [Gammaproteobacteria bacterium]|nr:hypothetical protein [Gammaproteobacteria bacterium]
MKKTFFVLAAIFLGFCLTGCEYLNSKISSNPPTQKEKICSEIKRNLVFNTTSVPNFTNASATQRAELMRVYHKNDCEQFEK